MDKAFLSIRDILDIIFRITNKNANILADCYLIKDSSLSRNGRITGQNPRAKI